MKYIAVHTRDRCTAWSILNTTVGWPDVSKRFLTVPRVSTWNAGKKDISLTQIRYAVLLEKLICE
jgi:hypothetical protein